MRQKSTVRASSRWESEWGYAGCGPSEVPFAEGSDGPRCTFNPCNTHLGRYKLRVGPASTCWVLGFFRPLNPGCRAIHPGIIGIRRVNESCVRLLVAECCPGRGAFSCSPSGAGAVRVPDRGCGVLDRGNAAGWDPCQGA
jgi:hypothetical protein